MWEKRSSAKELIDLGPEYYTPKEYQHCLKKLFLINKLLGFFANTKKTLKKISKTATILDVGCGSGLFLLHLSRHFPEMKFIGIDISSSAIQQAQQNLIDWKFLKTPSILFKEVTAAWEMPPNSVDVLVANLLCHHLTNEELIHFFRQSLFCTKEMVIIHDLHRHPLSYRLYKWISPFFRNRLITHDGLISIQRGFKKKELIFLLNKAGIKNYDLSWHFPFCWRIVLWKK